MFLMTSYTASHYRVVSLTRLHRDSTTELCTPVKEGRLAESIYSSTPAYHYAHVCVWVRGTLKNLLFQRNCFLNNFQRILNTLKLSYMYMYMCVT